MKRILVPAALTLALGASALAQAPAKPAAPAAEKKAPAPEQKETTAVDPICGMKVHPDKAAASATYQGKTYYFCSKGEKATFEKDPAKYVKK